MTADPQDTTAASAVEGAPGFFDRIAEGVDRVVSGPWFFAACLMLVVVWAPSLPLFGKLDTWQLVINTTTTIVTFLMVALQANAARRQANAANHKANVTADALADLMEAMVELVEVAGGDGSTLRADARDLRAAVGIEATVSA